ncbi:MAG: tetratricopeptide repeat protein [Syntrophobacteraceae bacterium]
MPTTIFEASSIFMTCWEKGRYGLAGKKKQCGPPISMYNQLIYFIVALLLFTIEQPGAEAFFPPLTTLMLCIASFFGYSLICFFVLHRLLRASLRSEFPRSSVSVRYYRTQTRLSILALVNFACFIFVFNIKFHLAHLPFFTQSATLSGSIGVALFLAHLCIIWVLSHPIYKQIHNSNITPVAFVKGQLGFNMAILMPWLLISFVFDLAEFILPSNFLNSAPRQFTFYSAAIGAIILFAPPLIVRLWGCETLPESPVRTELADFCRRQRFSVGDFKLWPIFGGEVLTAGITGILPKLRYILITRSLLKLLSPEELKAVTAHEIGHVRRYHLLLFIFFFVCYFALNYYLIESNLYDLFLLYFLEHTNLLQWSMNNAGFQQNLFPLIPVILGLILLVAYFRYIFGYFLRNCERQADLHALEIIGHPFTLISSLEKIALYSGNIHDLPSWHHFSIRERIDFLLDAHHNRSITRKHHRKLYITALVFALTVVCMIFGSIHLQESKFVKDRQLDLLSSFLEKKLRNQPENSTLYSTYGGVLLEVGRYKEAEAALRRALDIDPENATSLNNLAWLYATAPRPYLNPDAALKLSLEATKRSDAPEVLDTYAEALYANGHYAEALEVITRALRKNPENRDYFERRRERFEKVLRGEK